MFQVTLRCFLLQIGICMSRPVYRHPQRLPEVHTPPAHPSFFQVILTAAERRQEQLYSCQMSARGSSLMAKRELGFNGACLGGCLIVFSLALFPSLKEARGKLSMEALTLTFVILVKSGEKIKC